MSALPNVSFRAALMRSYELTTVAALVLLWIVVIMGYLPLPEVIPIHFDGSGNPDSYGNRRFIFIIPVIASLMYLLLFTISRYPSLINYPVKITEENKLRQFDLVDGLLRYIRLAVVALFYLIYYEMMLAISTGMTHPAYIVLLFIVVVMIVPVLFFIGKSWRKR